VLASARATIRRHAMLAGGDAVVVGVSGGADSIALLHVLAQLAPEWRLALSVLHVDHGLRADSARDAEVVRAVGRQLGVPVHVQAVTVARHGSLEAAARLARYGALEAHADRIGAGRIAVGHTLDDQAETVLMRLLARAGVRGLAGIPPVRGRVIRPLLAERRAALRSLLLDARLVWIEDPSNRDLRFLRNRVRHQLLPALERASGADVALALAGLGRLARGWTEALDSLAAEALRHHATRAPDAIELSADALAGLPPVVAAETLRLAMAELGLRAPLRAWAQRELRRALAVPPPRRPVRVGGVTLEASAGRIRVGRRRPGRLPPRPLAVPGRVALPEAGMALATTLLPARGYVVPRARDRAAFDADALPGPLLVRGRRRGDRLTPFGETMPRRLKRLLMAAGIARWQRGLLPLVQAGPEIAWVAGVRRAALAPVTGRTRRVLEISLMPLADPSPDQ
jgi:tRNA(Ile)-lysidine synthase